MMNEEMISKLEALLADDAFLKKFSETQSPEDAAALFCAEGVELSAEEVNKLLSLAEQDEELSVDALDDVAGGVINWWRIIRHLPRPHSPIWPSWGGRKRL